MYDTQYKVAGHVVKEDLPGMDRIGRPGRELFGFLSGLCNASVFLVNIIALRIRSMGRPLVRDGGTRSKGSNDLVPPSIVQR